jgi:hypothetical protein
LFIKCIIHGGGYSFAVKWITTKIFSDDDSEPLDLGYQAIVKLIIAQVELTFNFHHENDL